MDAQTIVAVVAAGISLAAMGVAIWQASEARSARQIARSQARTAEEALEETRKQTQLARDANTNAALNLDAAEKAANAALASADEARKANILTQQEHRRTEAAQASAAVAHARKVRAQLAGMNSYSVQVRNDASEPFYDIALEDIRRSDRPSWSWRLAPNVAGNTGVWDRIEAGGPCSFYIEFLDEAGVSQPFDMGVDADGANVAFSFTISYSDSTGQRWSRTDNNDPVPLATS